MGAQRDEWTVSTPFRALLWWPLVAFALVAVVPAASGWLVPLSGVLLAVIGGISGVIERWLSRRAANPTTRMSTEPSPIGSDPPTSRMRRRAA